MSKQGFELNQSQGLVMTQQMQQSMKMLQMTNLELNQFIEQSILANPFLEMPDQSSKCDNKNLLEPTEIDFTNPAMATNDLDTDYQNIDPEATSYDLSQETYSSQNEQSKNSTEFGNDQLENCTSEKTLKEHLLEQVNRAGCTSFEHIILLYLIDIIDPSGYLYVPVEDISKSLNVDEKEIQKVLTIAQGFSPTGVFARSVSECLNLQLKDRGMSDEVYDAILENIEILASYDLPRLAKKCKIQIKELIERISNIKSLTPKPGSAFYYKHTTLAIPDVIINQNIDQSWNVKLNSDVLPKVLVNKNYYKRVKTSNKQLTESNDDFDNVIKKTEEKIFITEQLSQANWLVNAMNQRAHTILNVAEEIIKQQDGFFEHGLSHMVPMRLQDVATTLDIHPSTVSRVTANKFMQTPRGIFEMKFFFSSSLKNNNDDNAVVSSTAIKESIRLLVQNETENSVLSDEQIVDKLNEQNFPIKRRTVAKYRNQLKIPSSAVRKRNKKFA